MSRINELRQRSGDINDRCQQIVATADGEQRGFSDEEKTEFHKLKAEFSDVQEELEMRLDLDRQTTKLAEPVTNNRPPPSVANPVSADEPNKLSAPARPREYAQPLDGKWGFPTLGHFALAVGSSSAQGATVDARLARQLAPTSWGSEGVGADGGFAVPPDFRAEIISRLFGEASLMGLTDRLVTSSNSMTVPVDETTDWQTSGGILSYWGAEAGQMTQSKPQIQQETMQLHKHYALVPVTEELLADAPAMDRYLRRKAPAKIGFAIDRAIYAGTGAGTPLGILNAPCTISVAKEGCQAADTIQWENILKIYTRMYGGYRGNANTVWLINQDIEPQLFQMKDANNNPVYMPGNMQGFPNVSGSPFMTLMGHRVILHQACETLGDKGDICFCAMGEYVTLTKTEGTRVDVSIHLFFDYDLTTFKFVTRVAGQPWLSTTIAARSGVAGSAMSSFVTLDERA